MSAESDVMRAVAAQWDAAGLNVTVPGKLHLDEGQRADLTPYPTPWAVFSVRQDRRSKFAMRSHTAFTRVTFTLYDTAVLGPAVDAVGSAFDWLNTAGANNVLDFGFNAPNVYHHYTEAGSGNYETVTALKRNGQRLRKAVISFVIWTQRLGG